MNCVIISIGDELLDGRTLDSNSAWLAGELGGLGIRVVECITVPDEPERIIRALRRGFDISEIVITTGGLGPTDDDLTRGALAEYLGVKLTRDNRVLDGIKEIFAGRGIIMPPNVAREALIPVGARPLKNSVGVAPGLFIPMNDSRLLIALPGVPPEMRAIFCEELAPLLLERGGGIRPNIESLFTVGIPESALFERVSRASSGFGTEGLAFYPSNIGVEVRIDTGAGDNNAAERLRLIREAVEPWRYSNSEKSLPAVVGGLLSRSGRTVSTAESCTGGLLSSRLVDVPGASDWFPGGIVSYSNEAKAEMLGVGRDILEKFGAVSPQVALSMASGAARLFGSTFALSTTGIAGPSGGTDEKPVGLVYYALHTPERTFVRRNRFTRGREDHRYRTSQSALAMLWLWLEGKYKDHPWEDGSREIEL